MNYEYLVLRAAPDAVRGESINIGMVVFSDEETRVLVTPEAWRLKAVHPVLSDIDLDAWAAELQGELSAFPTQEARKFIIGMMKEPIVALGEPSRINASSLSQCDEIVEQLFRRLITLPQRPFRIQSSAPSEHRSRLHTQLKVWFRTSRIFSPRVADLSKGKVVPYYPIAVDEDLYADFALKNSAIHVIETMDLRGIERVNKSLRGEVGFKSILLDQARRTLTPEGRRIAVVSADDYGVVKPLVTMLGRYADDLIAIESPADRQRLADFVSNSLHLAPAATETLGEASALFA